MTRWVDSPPLIVRQNLYSKHTHRCGAGTNNIPVARMTELGIPVFNTPGANANAVMELVICGLFLGSRRVIDGINHMTSLGEQGLQRERVGTCHFFLGLVWLCL